LFAEARNDGSVKINESRRIPYLKRHAPIIIGVALSVLIHACLIFFVIERNPVITHEKLAGDSDTLSITLLAPPNNVKPQTRPSQPDAPPRSKAEDAVKKKPAAPRIKNPKRAEPAVTKPDPNTLPTVPTIVPHSEQQAMRPPPADDMSSMLEAARRRRAQNNESSQESETQRRNKAVLANIATSMGQAGVADQNGQGGVFQLRHVGAISAEFLFRGWSTSSHRNTTQLVSVFKKSEPDIQTAIVKKMIEIIRDNKRDDFVWYSSRLGREITLSARPENEAQLEQFLTLEFFSDYVPIRQE
jgi:hypothetical protein